jgi:hypothetical protein
MAGPLAWLALSAVVLAGCMRPGGDDAANGNDDSSSPSSTSDTRSTPTDGPPGTTRIVLDGTLVPFGAGFVANVSAYNPGPETFGVGRFYCVSNYGAWTAELSGPPGDDLVYRDPEANQLYCAGETGIPMPPGSYWNWTFSGDWGRGACGTRYVCDNVWNGTLRDANKTWAPAPPGDYTWRFTFAYSVGASGGKPRLELQTLDLPVTLPA